MNIQKTLHKGSAHGASPWSLRERLALLAWQAAWPLLCGWTPKPLNLWRATVLRVFGMRVGRGCFIHQRARIQKPWRVRMADGACVGDRANLYSLDQIDLGERCIVAQEAYLCTGTHSREIEGWPLVTAPIKIGAGAFIGARAFVLPGVCVGDNATVGACAVVAKSVPEGCIVVGNPARLIRSSDNTDNRRVVE